MIYLKAAGGDVKIIILEAGNLDRLKAGDPAKTPDGTVLIAYTPDPVWLADKLMDSDGDGVKIAALIEEASKRPQKDPKRPTHGQHIHSFLGGK
jgi:hypothetical protein